MLSDAIAHNNISLKIMWRGEKWEELIKCPLIGKTFEVYNVAVRLKLEEKPTAAR